MLLGPLPDVRLLATRHPGVLTLKDKHEPYLGKVFPHVNVTTCVRVVPEPALQFEPDLTVLGLEDSIWYVVLGRNVLHLLRLVLYEGQVSFKYTLLELALVHSH